VCEREKEREAGDWKPYDRVFSQCPCIRESKKVVLKALGKKHDKKLYFSCQYFFLMIRIVSKIKKMI